MGSSVAGSRRVGKELRLYVLTPRSVPGVGVITAMTFATELPQPERFERPEAIGAITGLAPRVSRSGETVNRFSDRESRESARIEKDSHAERAEGAQGTQRRARPRQPRTASPTTDGTDCTDGIRGRKAALGVGCSLFGC